MGGPPHYSPDGQWFWDGARWRSVQPDPPTSVFDSAPPYTAPRPSPPRSASPGAAFLVGGLVVMVLIAGTAMGAILLGHHPRAQPPPRVAASSPVPAAPGWQTVVAVQQRAAYQVPRSWSVLPPDTVVGFEDAGGNPAVAMGGAAVYRQGYCPEESGSSRAGSGVSTSTGGNLTAIADDRARRWATAGFTPAGGPAPTVTLGRAQAVTAGGLRGEEVTATVRVHSTNRCDPPAGVVHVVAALTKSGGAVVMIVYADQGVPGAADEQDLRRVVASFRPAG